MTISMTVERRRLRARSLLILSTALCSGLAVPAFAQGADTLPVRKIVDSNGVDLSTGSFSVDETDLTIGGPGQHGLSFERTWIGDYWRHNYLISISEVLPGHAVLALGNSGAKFTKTGGVWVNDQGNDGSILESVAPGYKYTDRDGNVYIFDTSKGSVRLIV